MASPLTPRSISMLFEHGHKHTDERARPRAVAVAVAVDGRSGAGARGVGGGRCPWCCPGGGAGGRRGWRGVCVCVPV